MATGYFDKLLNGLIFPELVTAFSSLPGLDDQCATISFKAKDVIVINCPTMPYDHADPDKYRLPLDTDRIPYRFPAAHGW